MQHLLWNKHGRSKSASDGPRSNTARWWRAGALLFLALGASQAEDLAEPHHVTAVRFWSLGGVTRIAIETDGDFHLKSDRLDNPDRLFFDLTGTKPTLSHKSMTVIPVSDHFVRQIRVAEPQPNVTRVVLDLETPVEPTTSRLDNPTRLIIELRASGGTPETTEAPVKAPPTLVEPVPARKPVEHRPFTPPPATHPVAIPVVQSQVASLEPPPELQLRNAAAPIPALLAVTIRPGPSPARAIPVSVLAKPASASISPTIGNAISTTSPASIETALPAKRNSSGDRSMIRVLGLKVGRIVLDPGHGGHDTGTVGPEGLREKDLVLDVA